MCAYILIKILHETSGVWCLWNCHYKMNSNESSQWKGSCFVFDDRVAIDNNLNKSKYSQCYGCRSPITKKDTLSRFYKKGVTCPYCYNKRSIKQKMSSMTRQIQIEKAEKKNINHTFKKITRD